MHVWLVRHGETEWSATGRHTGRTDVPLLARGEAEASAAGRWLRAVVPTPALVLTSPRRRAVETCRLAGFGERAELCDDLAEWDYGDYEGDTTAHIRQGRPDWTLWTDGAPRGESPADVGRRADRVIERARAAGGGVLLFSHGHLLRVLAARWVGLPPAGGGLLALGAGAVCELGSEHGMPVVSRWNLTVGATGAAAGSD
ncbi:MAG: histidine phosphatase family protein [Acidimicrobiales bacterium]